MGLYSLILSHAIGEEAGEIEFKPSPGKLFHQLLCPKACSDRNNFGNAT